MPESVKTLFVVAGIVLLWAIASGVYGWLLRWVQPCMSLGVSICAVMLLILSHDENGWRRVTFQSYVDDPNEPPNFLPFFVWGTPFLILFMALVEVQRVRPKSGCESFNFINRRTPPQNFLDRY